MESGLTVEEDVGEEIDMSYEEFLIYSARLGEFDDVKFCIDEKVDLATSDESGNTALRKRMDCLIIIDMASANGHLDIAKLLLINQANPNAVNRSKNTPLRRISFLTQIQIGQH